MPGSRLYHLTDVMLIFGGIRMQVVDACSQSQNLEVLVPFRLQTLIAGLHRLVGSSKAIQYTVAWQNTEQEYKEDQYLLRLIKCVSRCMWVSLVHGGPAGPTHESLSVRQKEGEKFHQMCSCRLSRERPPVTVRLGSE